MDFKTVDNDVGSFQTVEQTVVGDLDNTPSNVDEKARLVASALNSDQTTVKSQLESNLGPMLSKDLQSRLLEIESRKNNDELRQGIEQQADIDTLLKIQDNSIFGENVAAPEEQVLAQETEFMRLERRAIRRRAMLSQLADQFREQTSEGLLDTVGEFADTLISDGIGNVFFNFTGERNKVAQAFGGLLFSDASDDEVLEEATQLFENFADQGFFTDENALYLEQFLSQAVEGGVGENARTDNIFETVDVASTVLGVVGTGGKAILRALKSGSAIDKIAKLKSSDEAVSLAVRAANDADDTADLVPNTSASILTPMRRDRNNFTSVGIRAANEIESQNEIIRFIREEARFAHTLDDDKIEELRQVASNRFIENLNRGDRRRFLDFSLDDDGLGNLQANAYLGRNKGGVFKTEEAADKVAKRLGGEVVEGQLVDGEAGWVVRIGHNVRQDGMVDPTDVRQIMGGYLSSLFSTTQRTDKTLDAILKRNEGQSSRVFDFVQKRYNKARRKVDRQTIDSIDYMMRELNENPALATRREPYTTSEFAVEFEKIHGSKPNQKQIDFYHEQLQLNDAAYVLKADNILKRAVENREVMYRIDDTYIRSRPVDNLSSTERVYDPRTKDFKTVEELGEATIIEIAPGSLRAGDNNVRYVLNSGLNSRPLSRGDVLGYNPGGSRVYDNSKFFVKQSALTSGIKPRTFMAVVTADEAMSAVKQINNIIDGIAQRLGSGLDDATIRLQADRLLSDETFVKLVNDNNDWNIGLDASDFIKFAEENGIDLSRKVDFAPDNEPLVGQRFVGAETVGEDFFVTTNSQRNVKPLIGYGGNVAETLAPHVAIERSFVNSINKFANRSYITRATGGWLKSANDLGLISNANDLVGKSNLEKLFSAKISETLPGGKELIAERNLIKSKLQYRTADMIAWDRFVDRTADWIYGKGKQNVSRRLRDVKDPITFLRAAAFNLKLGLFAIDQVFVQASQLVNIVGISSQGLRGMLNVMPLRLALLADNDGIVKNIATRAANVTGTSTEEFTEMLRFVRESGRDLVDANIIELDGNQEIFNSGLKRVLDAGRIPFNEGELAARLGAISSSFLEFKKKFPDVDPFSDVGRNWITRQQDILTASMSSASSAPWQRSALAIPTQFMTYNMRMVEQLFMNKILTPQQRLRLLGAQTFVWGAAGIGAGQILDSIAYRNEMQIDPALYNAVRHGALDYLISETTGADTALSERLGAFTGFTDFIQSFSEDSGFEIAAGPAGGIAVDVVSDVATLANNMFSGNWDYVSYDWQRLGRNITSANRAYNLWVGLEYQEYRNRKHNRVLLDDLNTADAFMLGLGVPLKEQELAFSLYRNQKEQREAINEHANRMLQMRDQMADYIDAGDRQAAKRVSDDIAAMFNMLTPYNREEVMRIWRREERGFFEVMLEREIDRGRSSVLTDVARGLNNDERN